MPKPFPAFDLGPLAVDTINRTLGTELEPGSAWLGERAHQHAAEKHPEDYPLCQPHLARVIAEPAYVGQAPHHGRNIMLVRRLPGASGSMLVAVGLEPDERGFYRVRSFYRITEAFLQRHRMQGSLRPVKT